MKSDSSLMANLAHDSNILRVMTSAEAINLKKLLVEMLRDLYAICNANGIKVILVGGSALGAVRHGGFIPWDDDLDVGMVREDYEKFIDIIESGTLDYKYEFTYPRKDKDTKNLFLKMYRRDTVYRELIDETSHFPQGVFIDVFPIDYTYSIKYVQRVKGLFADLLSFISVSVLYAQYPSKLMADYMSLDPHSLRRYKKRLLIGKAGLLFAKHKSWAYIYDRFVKKKKATEFLTIPTGRKHYYGEVLARNIFFPPSKGKFEDIEVLLPNHVDKYLKNLYGNYWVIPSEKDRERHYIVDISIL